MDVQKLLEINHFNLHASELQRYRDTYDVCMPCIERDVTMIKACGDRIRDNYTVAVYVLSRKPSLLWCFSIRIQTHPSIVPIVSHALESTNRLTLTIKRAAKIAKNEGLRREALCYSL